jgi:cell division protein FtsB
MKKIMNNISLLLGIGILLTACGGNNSLDAKKASLEQLKAQQAEIADQIKTLEEENLTFGKVEL